MDTDSKSGVHDADHARLLSEVRNLEAHLQLYDRTHDALIETLWDDEHERELVSEREPKLMLELIVGRVKTLRMEARTLRNEVHELEDAAARTRGEAAK